MKKTKSLKIGNAQGFWGDQINAPYHLACQQPDLDYLTLDYLAEVSMSIMAIQQQKNSSLGYARDFLDVVKSLIPIWKNGSQLKIVTNAGGLNPLGCAEACQEILKNRGCRPLKIAVITGDNILNRLTSSPDLESFRHLETGASLVTVLKHLKTANAYLGAEAIAKALLKDVDLVITGRVTDPSLTVGPCIAHFGWASNAFDQLAAATIAGHLLECGTQVTGGISTHWLEISDPAHLGYPFVEMEADGSFILTKPKETAGMVTMETVKEQLLYEIGDPDRFLGPDVITSFLSLELKQEAKDRIHVSGAKGIAPPATYKVSATYSDGFRAEGTLAVFGRDVELKARRSGEIILQRLKDAGYTYERSIIECLGINAIMQGIENELHISKECLLRICVADKREEAVERFTKEIASLVTSGPQGITGYTTGRPHLRPIFGYWPCLIAKKEIQPDIEILETS